MRRPHRCYTCGGVAKHSGLVALPGGILRMVHVCPKHRTINDPIQRLCDLCDEVAVNVYWLDGLAVKFRCPNHRPDHDVRLAYG